MGSMNQIKLQVRKCRCGCRQWLTERAGNILDLAPNHLSAMAGTTYWIRSFKEYRP